MQDAAKLYALVINTGNANQTVHLDWSSLQISQFVQSGLEMWTQTPLKNPSDGLSVTVARHDVAALQLLVTEHA